LMKAGNAYHKCKAQKKNWPVVSGKVRNAVDHPHGGGNHPRVRRSTCIARNASAGKKVGHIAPRRTGR